jgi:drug/metabolite transporter (DMT)-like permease
LAKLVLKEHIGARRVAGTLLVLGGVILVAR